MRHRFLYLMLLSTVLCCFGAALLLSASHAQDAAPEYEGASECESCHRSISRSLSQSPHTLTLRDVERRDEGLLADFDQGEQVRMVTFPGEDAPRPFVADDIKYVVGTGRNVQRYLYEVGRNDHRVFPAEWNVAAQQWQPFALAESWEDPAYDWEQNCAYCHTTGFDVERERPEDEGVQCEACHGPASLHAELASDAGRRPDEEELVAIRSSIYVGVDAQACGQCHSRGVDAEGRPYPAGYQPGQPLSDVFTLVAADDPVHWWVSGHASHPNMQYNEWLVSGHPNSLTALADVEAVTPQCLTCHSADYNAIEGQRARVESGDREGSAPESLTAETAQFGITCSSCHNVHAENVDHNAYLVAEGAALCAGCHSDADPSDGLHHAMLQMYEGTTLIAEVPGEPSPHFTAEDGPDCLTCHMPDVPTTEGYNRASHTSQPVLPGSVISESALKDSCSICHEEQVTPTLMQQLIDDIQTDTQARIERARAAAGTATPPWVLLALDLVEGDGSLGIHNYTYADRLLDAVEAALGLTPIAQEEAAS